MIRRISLLAVFFALAACQSAPGSADLSRCKAAGKAETDQTCEIEEIRDVRQDIQKIRKARIKRS